MKRISFFISVSILIIALSCKNENRKSTTEYQIEVVDSVANNEMNAEQESNSNDDTAIGNIHMNIDESQFELEKEDFLNNHYKFGGLTVKSLKGFFYNNRLAAIEIISDQQDIHRKQLEYDINEDGWYPMYKSKYKPAGFKDRIHPFSFDNQSMLPIFEKNHCLIEVSDLCDSPKGHNSFEDIINSPKRLCYGHNLMPLELDESNNIMRAASVMGLINELPKERANNIMKQYDLEKKSINTDNLILKIASESALDKKYFNALLPEVQAHRDKLLNLHKNDPSWSFIIIYYKPLLEKYKQDQEKLEERRNQEKNRELDII